MGTYIEKLKDPRWQKKRLEIMKRDDFTCQNCSAKDKTLNVHHWTYSKNPWDTKDENLSTLCEDCHGKIKLGWEKIINIALAHILLSQEENTLVDRVQEVGDWLYTVTYNDGPFYVKHETCMEIISRVIGSIENTSFNYGRNSRDSKPKSQTKSREY